MAIDNISATGLENTLLEDADHGAPSHRKITTQDFQLTSPRESHDALMESAAVMTAELKTKHQVVTHLMAGGMIERSAVEAADSLRSAMVKDRLRLQQIKADTEDRTRYRVVFGAILLIAGMFMSSPQVLAVGAALIILGFALNHRAERKLEDQALSNDPTRLLALRT